MRETDAASAALLESQAGPHAARVLTARSTQPEFTLASPIFRAILLRRLRLPLPLTAARCRCRALHDHCGDHLAACPRSGLLRARGGPVERAAARICREAGATVALNVLVRDLNVNPVRQDDRRIEAIANDRLLQRIPHLDDLQDSCKPRGCCSSLAQPPELTTCCAYCPRT